MDIKDMELAKTVFDPKRLRILKAIEMTAKTVKEIAGELNEKPSRLYYHIHKLLEQGLIEIADTKQLGHLTETYYIAKDVGSFNIDEVFARENKDFIIQQLLFFINKGIESIRMDLNKKEDTDDVNSQASLLEGELTQEDWFALNAEIRKLINQRNREGKENAKEKRKPIKFILMSYVEEND